MSAFKFNADDLTFGPALEVKLASADADAGWLEGYASTFGNQDLSGDTVAQGAFRKSIAAHSDARTSPVMLWSHKADQPIGKWTSLREDSKGLLARGKLDLNVRAAAEAHSLLKSGAVNGLSIGFQTKKADRDPKTGARRLLELELFEISIVALPMNPAATVTGVKQMGGIAEIETALRTLGYSRSRAKAMAGAAWRQFHKMQTPQLGKSLIDRIEQATARLEQIEGKYQ